MNLQQKSKEKGFTIIEVVLVLAIAGLIFLMVFIALPALQRSQRDTQREGDLSRVSTQINSYQSSNRGNIPSNGNINSFVQNYLGGEGSTAGSEYADPQTGSYVFTAPGSGSPDVGQIYYSANTVCGNDGAATGTGANARNFTLRVGLEGQTVPHCIDNR